MSCINQLSDHAKQNLLSSVFSKNYFLWVGSGFSYNFGYGSWEAVLIKVKETIEYEMDLNVSNPLKAAELLCSYARVNKGYTDTEFNAVVADSLLALKVEKDEPDWKRKFRTFAPNMLVTTNWDNLLEGIFDGLANVIVRKDKRPQVSNTGRNIFKIHGDVGRPSSIVVTQSQYFEFQREDTYLNRKIYTLFSEASPIFVGYSLTDPNIGFIYDEVYAHMGEEKPPAYMVVHPSTKDSVLSESKLLFENKNIYIIKAEIGEFLEDLLEAFKDFKKSAKRFFIEHSNIEVRLRDVISKIIDKKRISRKDLLDSFNTKDSRNQAVKAFVEVLDNQILYQEFGGELLSPENRISYREIDQIIGAVIWLVNEDSYPDLDTKEIFHKAVVKSCAKSDGVWDFYTADRPFLNILRISPGLESEVFEERLNHIIEVLRWSSPNEIGKCWSTWNIFVKHIEWLREDDINKIVHGFRHGRYEYRPSDGKWLRKLKTHSKCIDEQKQSIDEIIE
jgi:hypothetical protein